jgi:hypothetical protein
LPINALATALAVSLVPAVTSAQTAFGVLNVWLKKHGSADAPNDQQITLYKKSKARVIGMDHYSDPWLQLSNGIKDVEEVAKALTAQGFEVRLKKDLKSRDLDDTLRDFSIYDGDVPNAGSCSGLPDTAIALRAKRTPFHASTSKQFECSVLPIDLAGKRLAVTAGLLIA